MFKFFKKKEDIKPVQKETKKEAPFNPRLTADELQKLYDCSVQRTANDFVLNDFDVNGNKITVAMDEAVDYDGLQRIINKTYEMQLAGQEVIFRYFAKRGFIGFNNCSILSQDWLIQKAITAPVEDAVAVAYSLNSNEKEITEEEKDVMTEIKNISDDITLFDIKDVCKKFTINKRKFGQSLCIPLIDGVDYSKPFNIDAVGYHTYKGMVTIEPVWVVGVLDIDGTINPLSRSFYKPKWFRLPNGTLIHHSWCVFGVYGDVADILKPTYFWGGIPLPQMLYEQVYAAHKTAMEAPALALTKRSFYIDGQPESMLFNRKEREQITALSWVKDNFGWIVKKPNSQIGQLDTTLTDFDNVVMLSYQLVAAISGVIATRLLETSPKGWQSSGSYEDKQYSKLLKSILQSDFKPILELHYKLLAKSKYNLDKEYIISFADIDVPTAKETAEIREINARTDSTYINAGVLAPDEVRQVLRENENSGYPALEEELPEEEENPF